MHDNNVSLVISNKLVPKVVSLTFMVYRVETKSVLRTYMYTCTSFEDWQDYFNAARRLFILIKQLQTPCRKLQFYFYSNIR